MYITRNCVATMGALARVMNNLAGPSQKKKHLLMGVVRYIDLYAAPMWSAIIGKKIYTYIHT